MRVLDVLDRLVGWWREGRPSALATVTATWSSAPRMPGSAMAVGPDGTVAGSVSGGCVESAVYEICQEVIETVRPRTVRFGVSDHDAYSIGLTCGGTVEIAVERVDRTTFGELGTLAEAVGRGTPIALGTRLDTAGHLLVTLDGRHGTLGSGRIDDAVTAGGREMLAAGRTGKLTYEGLSVLVSSFAPPARMIVFGSTRQAAATARMGAFLGYRVTVCDARPVFTTGDRLPDADEVVVDWPHRYLGRQAELGLLDVRTVVLVLTHDPKFDVPVLEVALRLPLAYVGAMGSRRTHDDRRKRLLAAGLSECELDRLSSPIGLDLGARTPEETAVSIAAEIVALGRGGSGVRLATTDGPIHTS